jgi:hypothetical protein
MTLHRDKKFIMEVFPLTGVDFSGKPEQSHRKAMMAKIITSRFFLRRDPQDQSEWNALRVSADASVRAGAHPPDGKTIIHISRGGVEEDKPKKEKNSVSSV